MAALTADALWIQETWQLRRVPLQTLGTIEVRGKGMELALTLRPEAAAEKVILTLASAPEGERWYMELQERRQLIRPDAPPSDRHLPEGVSLVRRAPDGAQVVLGLVAFMDRTPRSADRGLQLRAGMLGADAVINLARRKCPEVGWGARHVSGLAVRVEDATGRQRLRRRYYAEECSALVNRLLVLLVLQAALLFVVGVFCAGATRFHEATGETLPEALASTGLGLGLFYAWPLALLALLGVLRWPSLLRAVGLAVLAATTGRCLAVWLAHLLAVQTTGAGLAAGHFWMLVDPVAWAFVIAGVVLCMRAWRLAADAPYLLPPDGRAVSMARKAWARGLLAVTGVYALAFLGIAGTARYQASTRLLQPGVDPLREQEALLALNEGVALADKGELCAAARSLRRSLRLWEELTGRRLAPSIYRAMLATTLNDLGWIRQQQGRGDEAEEYYARAVALADELDGDPQLDDEFKRTMAGAREALAGLRCNKLFKALDEKGPGGSPEIRASPCQGPKGSRRSRKPVPGGHRLVGGNPPAGDQRAIPESRRRRPRHGLPPARRAATATRQALPGGGNPQEGD
jgi:hypothetical protein